MSVFQLLANYGHSQENSFQSSGISSPTFWKTPSSGHLKINTDAGCHNSDSWRLGAVFRSDNGSIVLAAAKLVRGRFNPDIAEALAVCWALQIAESH